MLFLCHIYSKDRSAESRKAEQETTEMPHCDSTDWNSKENAKMWRRDLADTINATNEQLGIAVHWEHRSFKEQRIEREPTMRRNSSRQGR